jgi:AraC-like DNA-binding protein
VTRAPPASQAYLTASILGIRELFAYAAANGADVNRMSRALGIAPALLDDHDARIPDATRERAWAEVEAVTGDDALGLHVAEHSEEGAYEVLDYAMWFSSTLDEAISRMARFYRLLTDAVAIEVVPDGDATHVRRLIRGTHPQEQDAYFALLCCRGRAITHRDIRPRVVCFEHAPRAQKELGRFFGCPIRFGLAQSDLVFASADLALPVRTAKPRLASLLDRYATDLLDRLPHTSSYADHVRQCITHVIRCEPPTVGAVAREMHASPRTVQRRLAEAGTTHKRLVEEIRRELALRYIETSELSITEIAFLLGFRDESSFRRSFRRWTGKSPAQARTSSRST